MSHNVLNNLSRRIAPSVFVAAAALVTALPAGAQQPAAGATTPPQASGQQRPSRQTMDQLFTKEEHDQYRQRMQAAKTPEERAKLRDEMRQATEQRAKEKGITLPQRPMHGSQRGDHRKMDGAKADGTQQSARPSRQVMDQLFTKEEHDQYRKRMQEAKTPEERAKLRDEMHKATEQRAKEKGIELPKRPMRGPHGPRGADNAPGKDGSAPAATPKP